MTLLATRYTIDFVAYVIGLPIFGALIVLGVAGFVFRKQALSATAGFYLVLLGVLGLALGFSFPDSTFTRALAIVSIAIGVLYAVVRYRAK